MRGRLAAIWIKRGKGAPMDALASACLVAGSGLSGNANRGGRRQVTVLDAGAWRQAEKEVGRPLDPRLRRSNLFVEGIDLERSRGRVLVIGDARVLVLGETRPCRQMEEACPGLQAALGRDWRGGVYGEVLGGGGIQVGDGVAWEEPAASEGRGSGGPDSAGAAPEPASAAAAVPGVASAREPRNPRGATRRSPILPVERVVAAAGASPAAGRPVGLSRQGRAIEGWVLGSGPRHISLIAGCHADEPVGPRTLRLLVGYLQAQPLSSPLLRDLTWYVVPHVHPDGEARNLAWSRAEVPLTDARGSADVGFEIAAYLRHVVRDPPGEDREFGFPRGPSDLEAHAETRSVASFLGEGAPFVVHGSLHGMAFAPGPWFLLEDAWVERSRDLRERLRRAVRELGYRLYDLDRRGEKGFWRIDEGFSTRPDSGAMATHFAALGDVGTAALFRPSSMEHVRSLGGDPFTFVSEMPLFLRPEASAPGAAPEPTVGEATAPALRGGPAAGMGIRFQEWLRHAAAGLDDEGVRDTASSLGVRAMPLRDQQRLQLLLIDAAIDLVWSTLG